MSLCVLCCIDCANCRQCFGKGSNGVLGNGGTSAIGSDQTGDDVPYVYFGANFTPTALSTGDGYIFHHCALSADASLLCWGKNGQGRLGVGDTTDRTSPVTPLIEIAITAAPTSAPTPTPSAPSSAQTTTPTSGMACVPQRGMISNHGLLRAFDGAHRGTHGAVCQAIG